MERFKPCLVRGFNNYDVRAASDEASWFPGDEPSLTQQHFAEECDINVIVERFGLLGELPQNVRPPVYGDFTGVSDYQTALNVIIAADEAFMRMPAKVRARFENDPALFVDFCSDPGNIKEMREMGLAVPEEKSREPVSVRVVGEVVGVKDSASGGGAGGESVAVGRGESGVRPGAGAPFVEGR